MLNCFAILLLPLFIWCVFMDLLLKKHTAALSTQCCFTNCTCLYFIFHCKSPPVAQRGKKPLILLASSLGTRNRILCNMKLIKHHKNMFLTSFLLVEQKGLEQISGSLPNSIFLYITFTVFTRYGLYIRTVYSYIWVQYLELMFVFFVFCFLPWW